MRHDSAARFVSTLLQIGPTKINCTERKIRRCRALQRAKELRGTVMPRLRRLSGLCSSNVSDTANRLRRTPFRSGHMSVICARLGIKGRAGVQRGRETAGVPSFCPRGGRRDVPAAAGGAFSAEVQRKIPRPLGANTLTRLVYPHCRCSENPRYFTKRQTNNRNHRSVFLTLSGKPPSKMLLN